MDTSKASLIRLAAQLPSATVDKKDQRREILLHVQIQLTELNRELKERFMTVFLAT